jgi:uncharacterized protein
MHISFRNIQNRLLLALVISLYINTAYSQLKLKDIPINLATINKKDNKGKQGIWYNYDTLTGTVFAMMEYKNDTLNGYFERYWSQSGRVSERTFFKNGKIDSIFVSFWQNGNRRNETMYKNGKKDGITMTFNQGGKLTSRYRYVNGHIDNSYKDSYKDSSVVLDSRKIDTIVTLYPSDWNKKYNIYVNDSLKKDIIFCKDVINIENYYENGLLKKRNVYSVKAPYTLEKIFYYQKGELSKTEIYNKKGVLIKTTNSQ